MLVRYKLYRASKPEEAFNAEMIKINLENDDHLIAIDDILAGVLAGVLAQHIQNLSEVKKYGIAYVGRMEIVNIEITDEGTIDLDETKFRAYMTQIMPYLTVVWNKTTNNIDESKNIVKIDFKKK